MISTGFQLKNSVFGSIHIRRQRRRITFTDDPGEILLLRAWDLWKKQAEPL